ncbi:hypothetical protein B7P43_G06262 [Cryptotermes secundus]|uniref:Reverse transcriptase domain-containing protein n=1 Tax=Cryptotermes secundus TaxID=105785 RepID=A0A2J7PQH3_9NEOP|nr:hypothetical protein B7P43_G06262 [Cryptotermes secundus]
MLDTISDLVGKVEKIARKPWVTQEMMSKMEERRKWKNVNNEEGRRKYRRLRNELKRATDRAKKEYLEKICNEIMEFQRTGRYDLMYMKTKELGWKENHGIQNVGIEDSQGNRIVDQRQVLKIWENYISELYDRPNRPETLEVEPEEEVDTDEKGPYILQSEVEKAIKEMRKGKATGDDDVPGDVLKLLGEGGLKTLTKLMNTIYESGEWPKDFTEVTMIALKKKTKATKCSDHRTISLIAHTAKIIAKILKRRIERKIEDVLGEDQFGFRRGKGTRDAIGMMRIIAERTLEIDEELCVCFIDWQKAFDRVNWTKLMQILKETGIDWHERRLISKLYMDQKVRVRLDRGETGSVQIGRGVRQGCCLSPILFNLYSECLTKEALDGLGDFKVGGQIIQTVKYADDLVLMAKEETVLQGMIDRLIEIGRCYGMEMNVEKTKVMKISRQPTPVTIKIDQKQVENVKCFKYLGSLLTDDGRCTCEIKSRIAMAKAAFSKKKNLFTSKLDLNLRKKLVKCYIWSIALYGAETWTLRAVDQKHLESFEMWCWRRMEKISWTDYVRNEEVLIRVSEQRNILHEIRKRKANWIGHVLRRNCLLKEAIEGKIDGRIEVTRRRGRRRKKMLDDLGDRRGYCHLKEKALDRIKWRNYFERDCGPVVLTDY